MEPSFNVSLTARTYFEQTHCDVNSVLPALQRLEILLSRLSRLPIRATPERAWGRFFALPAEVRSQIMESWQGQSTFIEGALEQGLDIYDEVEMLKYAAGKLCLLGDSSLFTQVEKDDVVEIFNSDFVQIYRSYNCFALCNYSLLELATYPFFELYDRPATILDKLVAACEPLFQGKRGFSDLSEMPEYSLRELMTEEGTVFSMRERFCVKVVSALSGQNYAVSVKKVTELGAFPIRYI
jgi:hypothetical protein